MPSPELTLFVEQFNQRPRARKVFLILCTESDSLGLFDPSHQVRTASILPANGGEEWEADFILIAATFFESREAIVEGLQGCAARCKSGAILIADVPVDPLAPGALRSGLEHLNEARVPPRIVLIPETEEGKPRQILCCRKLDADDSGEGDPVNGGTRQSVTVAPASKENIWKLVSTLASAPSRIAQIAPQHGVSMPSDALRHPELASKWLDAASFSERADGALSALREHCRIRPARPRDVANASGAPNVLALNARTGSSQVLGVDAKATAPAQTTHIAELESNDLDPGYLALFLEEASSRPLTRFEAADAEETTLALGLLPVAILPRTHQTSIVAGHELARGVEASLQVLRDDLIRQRARLWLKEAEQRPALVEIRELHAVLADKTTEALEGVVREALDRLPSPLAAVLSGLGTPSQDKPRLEVLLVFFEAAAILHATSLWSGCARLQPEFRTEPDREDLSGRPLLERPTFGTWVVVADALARRVRLFADSKAPGNPAGALRIAFADRSLLLPSGLSSMETLSVLDKAREIRNRVGHDGQVSVEAAAAYLGEAEGLLKRYLRLTRELWTAVTLILPGTFSARRGEFTASCRAMRGNGTPPISQIIMLSEAVDTDALALHVESERHCLPLLPLVRLTIASDLRWAFSFFGGLNDDNTFKYNYFHHSVSAPPSISAHEAWSGEPVLASYIPTVR
jgi:hypothetical protein